MMERPRPQSKVSLEDLIRLKRAERPAPEFWAEFEEQLRRKQLAAIVDKRPWWRRLSTVSFAKLSLPVGATAVIAFTLVSLRDRAQPASESDVTATASARASVPATIVGASVDVRDAQNSEQLASAEPHVAVVAENSSSTATTDVASTSGHRSSETDSSARVAPRATHEPSLAQVILGLEGMTENDARPDYGAEGAPLLASMNPVGSGLSSSISMETVVPANPLSQIASSRDGRRARLLASVDSQEHGDLVAGNSRVARSRERIASRLTEQALYDSISRLGLNGDSVTIKF